MRLSVIIPALNEQETIQKLLKKVFAQEVVSEVIVVNDGSKDNTKQILQEIKSSHGQKKPSLYVLTHNKNRGKGAAIRTGLQKTKGDFVIIQDADLEYNPKEYKKLLKYTSEKVAVYGSRIKGNNPHAYARTYLGNVLITAFFNFLFGINLTDIYTCYKLLPVKIAKELNISSYGFEVEAEITAKLIKQKVEIIEVPISYKPRSYEKGKKIKAKDALAGALTLLRIRFS